MAKIIGPIACPACIVSGHDMDSCRANELPGKRILCINCGSYPEAVERDKLTALIELPSPIRQVAATLLRSWKLEVAPLALNFIGKGKSEIISPERAAAAVAQNAVEYLADLSHEWTVGFGRRHCADTLIVKFDDRGAATMPEADCRRLVYGGMNLKDPIIEAVEIERKLIDAHCPVELAAAVARLVQAGFTVSYATLNERIRRVSLRFNPVVVPKAGSDDQSDPAADKKPAYSQTIRAEATFYL